MSAACAARGAAGQRLGAWLEGAAASARPPAGVAGSTALYGLLGGRLRLQTTSAGALELAGRGGVGGGRDASRWGEGEAGWEIARARRQLAGRLRAEVFGLDYAQPFDYAAAGAALQPALSAAAGDAVVSLRGDLRRGRWRLRHVAADSTSRGDLALSGGTLTVAGLLGPAWTEAGAVAYRGAGDGWYAGALGSAWTSRGAFSLGLTATAWNTPRGGELGVLAGAALDLGAGSTLQLQVGRNPMDPLYGTPGSFGASLGFAVRLAGRPAGVRGSPVVEQAADRRARFRLHRPRAHAVALAGDFTAWKPRPMTRSGDDWTLELTLPPGVHHFSFVLDGREWFVPADAPGVAEDEWGRKNATFVVER